LKERNRIHAESWFRFSLLFPLKTKSEKIQEKGTVGADELIERAFELTERSNGPRKPVQYWGLIVRYDTFQE
jgi:hypothetical protein